MSTYKPTVIIAGRENQLDDPDGLEVAHLDAVDYINFDLAYMDGVAEGRLQWNNTDGTLEFGMPGGDVNLQIGQELLHRVRNETGSTIPNGTVVYPSGASGNKLLIGIASNDTGNFPSNQPFAMTTENIAHNDNGYVTVFGNVRDVDTSSWNEGDLLFLGTNGGLLASAPEAPATTALCAAVVRKHASEGILTFRWGNSYALNTLADVHAPFGAGSDGDTIGWITANSRYELYAPGAPGPYTKAAFYNGTIRESFDFLLSSNGTTITGTLQKSGGGDLIMQFSDGETVLDCTPAQTLDITPGTDANPTGYMVYIPQDTKTLTIATEWPMFTQHIKVAYILVPSATYVLDHLGGYVNQNWNDHLSPGGATANDQGHLAHIGVRIRQAGADWYSGVSPDGADDSYFTINTGNVYWQSTTGIVSQFHPHTFTEKDTTGTDLAIVVNDPDSTYNHIQNFYAGVTKDSTGSTISNNRYFNLVFWGVANKTGDGDWLMVNLPSGVYTLESGATADTSSYDNYNFPREFDIESGTAFLICRATFKMGTTGWTWVQTEDLRGLSPSKVAGGIGTSDHGSLGGLADDDHTQYSLVDGTRAFTGNITVQGDIISDSGDVTLESGDITLNSGDITLNSGNVALTGGDVIFDGALAAKVIDANKYIYLRTDGDDANGGTSTGDAFLTPARALAELHKWVADEYVLTVSVGEGTFNVATYITPSHSSGERVAWTGVAAAHTSLTINNIDGAASALSAGLEYIDFDVNFAGGSGAAVGMFVLVKTTSGGANPNLVKGCHEIIAWSADVATVRCVRAAGVTTLPSGTITADTLTLVKTVFNFNTPSHGIFASSFKHCGTWNGMVFKGSLAHVGIWLTQGAVIVLSTNFGTSKWSVNLSVSSDSRLYAPSTVHSYGQNYIATADTGGSLAINSAILSGCWDTALRSFDNSTVGFEGGQVICGSVLRTIQALRGGYINAVSSVVEGSLTAGSTAFYAASGGGLVITSATDDAATSNTVQTGNAGNGAYIAF